MPFKGDMRLGGPHDNERTLNGTHSDFVSVPAAGTVLNTLYQVQYPVSQGGGWAVNSSHPNQVCDVDEVADGIGGQHIDWSSVRNVNFIFGSFTVSGTSTATISLPSGNNLGQSTYVYESGTYEAFYEHDGQGGATGIGGNSVPASAGGLIVAVTYPAIPAGSVEVPSGGPSYPSGTRSSTEYLHDGSGYYTENSNVTPYPQGYTYYSTSQANYTYVFETGQNYPNGTYSSIAYVADGQGGYSELNMGAGGNYYSSGSTIYADVQGQGGWGVELYTDNGYQYFYPDAYGTLITWNGSGGYNYQTNWTWPAGTFIASGYGFNYYWDGYGGYYSEGS